MNGEEVMDMDILTVLRENPGVRFTPSALARKLGEPTSHVALALVRLDHAGRIHGEGNGSWRKFYAAS